MNKCLLCRKKSKDKLCSKHSLEYIWDSSIHGYRRKKRNTGSRYTLDLFHKTETQLVKILEHFYGPENIVTSYRPLWAVSSKGALFEFDIYIKNMDILVEYNGKQHYCFTKIFHKNRKGFLNQKRRDSEKFALVNKQGVTLVVFNYDEPIVNDYVINKISNNK